MAVLVMDASFICLVIFIGLGFTLLTPMGAALSALFALISMLWPQKFSDPKGSLSTRDVLLSLSLVLLLSGTRLDPWAGVYAWWLVGMAVAALVSGIFMSLKARREGYWTKGRSEIITVLALSLATIMTMAFIAEGVLNLRSDSGMLPGRMDFLYHMAVWTSVWFGFDAGLRLKKSHDHVDSHRLWDWIVNNWKRLVVLLAACSSLLPAVVS